MARAMDPDRLPDAAFEKMGISRQDFKARMAYQKERSLRTPKAGSPAPDFEIERLSPAGERIGERFRLSSVRGRPVALVFGSYT